MEKAFIFYQDQKIHFEIPPKWKVLTFAQFNDYPLQRNVRELTKIALKNPIQSRSLKDSLSPSDRIAIIVEDLTRPSPKRLILEALMEELEHVPVQRENISVIISVGTHRGLTPEELETTYGRELLDRYEFVNHDCYASDLSLIHISEPTRPY